MSAQLFNQFNTNNFKQHLATKNSLNLRTIFRLNMYSKERKANQSNTRDITARIILEAIHREQFTSYYQLRMFIEVQRKLGAGVPALMTISKWLEKYELNALGSVPTQSTQIMRKYAIAM